jgi:hypothetical protein
MVLRGTVSYVTVTVTNTRIRDEFPKHPAEASYHHKLYRCDMCDQVVPQPAFFSSSRNGALEARDAIWSTIDR